MACSAMACKRVACDCVTCSCVVSMAMVSMAMVSRCVASRGRGHQISTTLKPSTERLVSILCKVNFLGLILDNGK